MKTKPRKSSKPVVVKSEPRRMYLGFLRTEREIAALDQLRAEAVRQHNEWVTERRPCWLTR